MYFNFTYNHTLDAKNRLFIPAKFREQLGEEFVIFKGPEKCLYVYDKATFEEVSRQFITKDRTRQRSFFSQVHETGVDKQGRVTLSADEVEHACLSKDAVIIGAGQRVEIWAAEEFQSAITPISQLDGIDEFIF
ncbi:MAG: division/cell wall cluster transcriptional repressor MraZ [Oscillospiraceae bacterium]|nr:division/cell wall cluster transcriptional repressor MraZ [Oscillospiraceae bacterium]